MKKRHQLAYLILAFTLKEFVKTDGSVGETCKARLVVGGFQKGQGMDFEETFATVVSFMIIRLIPSVV